MKTIAFHPDAEQREGEGSAIKIASTNPYTCHPDPELAKEKGKDPQLHFHALRVPQGVMFDCGCFNACR
jgi:hypothetical protein